MGSVVWPVLIPTQVSNLVHQAVIETIKLYEGNFRRHLYVHFLDSLEAKKFDIFVLMFGIHSFHGLYTINCNKLHLYDSPTPAQKTKKKTFIPSYFLKFRRKKKKEEEPITKSLFISQDQMKEN